VNGINPQGDVVGEFGATATSPHRGFQLGTDGVYTAFDFPGATVTSLVGINARGEIAGSYTLPDGSRHTFLLAAGRITKIDYPGATTTGPLGISPLGEVIGAYQVNGAVHAFIYSTGSGFTTIDYPNATYTNATGRNASGDVVGRYLDAANVSHGYIFSNGQFTSVDYPGASFTGFTAIDPAGNITGRAIVDGVTHGFMLQTTQAPQRYTITDLGLVGAQPGQPIALTNNGRVAGTAVLDSGFAHAVIWSRTGAMTDLGSAGLNSIAFGMNESGLTVGQTEVDGKDPGGEDFCLTQALGLPGNGATCVPFAAQSGAMRVLRTLGGANGRAITVNGRAQIVGTAENRTLDPDCPSPQKYEFKPVLWHGDAVQELTTASGDRNGVAYSVNDNGQIVGGSGRCSTADATGFSLMRPLHALLWEAGSTVDLGNLGGKGKVLGHFARAINNNGEAAGYSDIAGDTAAHAFRWTRNAGMQDLGTVAGDGHSVGLAINDQGVITGVSVAPDFSSFRAFVWRAGVMTDLNQLVPAKSTLYLLTACSINSRGEITGFSVDATGKLHGYLAVPVGPGEAAVPMEVNPRKPSRPVSDLLRRVGLGFAPGKLDR
jgi:probable HAF family extracellular repeat protein